MSFFKKWWWAIGAAALAVAALWFWRKTAPAVAGGAGVRPGGTETMQTPTGAATIVGNALPPLRTTATSTFLRRFV
jgi:hypothetical protein